MRPKTAKIVAGAGSVRLCAGDRRQGRGPSANPASCLPRRRYLIYQDRGLGDSQPQNMPGTEWKSTNLNSFLWGLIRQDLPVINCRLANGQRLGIEEIGSDETPARCSPPS